MYDTLRNGESGDVVRFADGSHAVYVAPTACRKPYVVLVGSLEVFEAADYLVHRLGMNRAHWRSRTKPLDDAWRLGLARAAYDNDTARLRDIVSRCAEGRVCHKRGVPFELKHLRGS